MSVIIKVEDILLKTIASLHTLQRFVLQENFQVSSTLISFVWVSGFEIKSRSVWDLLVKKVSRNKFYSIFKEKKTTLLFFPRPWQQISLSCNLSWVIIVRGCHSGSFFAAIGELHSDEGRGWCWCCCRSRSQRCRRCQRRQRSGLI